MPTIPLLDYQSKRHCPKTFYPSTFAKSCWITSQNDTAPKLLVHGVEHVAGWITSQNDTAPKPCVSWRAARYRWITSQNDTAPKRMKVEGYDPDELYDRWKLSLAGSEHPLRKDSNGGSFLRIVGEHSIEDDLAATNPRYNDGPEWRKNCQRCVGAYEMRRRGYDVTALPANLVDGHLDYSDPLPNRFDPNGWPSMFAGAELEKIPGTTANAIRGRIERMMSDFGDESRAIVRVKYKRRYGGGGHVFIAEQVDGSTRFIDPQTGSSDCSSYFSMISSGETEILRVDDKDVTDLIKKAVG